MKRYITVYQTDTGEVIEYKTKSLDLFLDGIQVARENGYKILEVRIE